MAFVKTIEEIPLEEMRLKYAHTSLPVGVIECSTNKALETVNSQLLRYAEVFNSTLRQPFLVITGNCLRELAVPNYVIDIENSQPIEMEKQLITAASAAIGQFLLS